MERAELIVHLEHLAEYVKYSEDAPALREIIALLKTHEERTETHACDLIKRQDAIDAVNSIDNLDAKARGGICFKLMGLPPAQPDVPDTNVGDIISRQAAIEALYKKASRLTVAEEYCYEDHVAWSADVVYRDVMEGALLELPPAQPEQRWIPCSERLPKKHGESYLVTISDGAVYTTTLQWDANGKRWYLSFFNDGNILVDFIDDVIAWLPLPEPYQAERWE